MNLIEFLADQSPNWLNLGQTGQQLIESGRMWYRIGAVGIAFGGLMMGLSLILPKDKPDKPTSPAMKMTCNVIGVFVILGGIGVAIYMFATLT